MGHCCNLIFLVSVTESHAFRLTSQLSHCIVTPVMCFNIGFVNGMLSKVKKYYFLSLAIKICENGLVWRCNHMVLHSEICSHLVKLLGSFIMTVITLISLHYCTSATYSRKLVSMMSPKMYLY
jgi:hypothetical protein